jgi:hypothetical protein
VVGAGIVGCTIATSSPVGRRCARHRNTDAGTGRDARIRRHPRPYIEGHASETLRTLGKRSLDLYDGFMTRRSPTAGATSSIGATGRSSSRSRMKTSSV